MRKMSSASLLSKAFARSSSRQYTLSSTSTPSFRSSRSRTNFTFTNALLNPTYDFSLAQKCLHTTTRQPTCRLRSKTGDGEGLTKTRRMFSGSAVAMHKHLTPPKAGEELHITFVDKEGDEHMFTVAKGDNLLDIALENDLEMEGACGGSCACSTCHVIVEDETLYDKMDEPDDDENDMLDLAFGLTETSRLGCQVKMRSDLDGLRIKLPAMTRNLQASDFSKKT